MIMVPAARISSHMISDCLKFSLKALKNVFVVPDHVSDADMVLLARDIAKQIEAELEYPGQIKVNVIRESRAVDYAK